MVRVLLDVHTCVEIVVQTYVKEHAEIRANIIVRPCVAVRVMENAQVHAKVRVSIHLH